ncbi:MAG: hypothetical protein GX442_09730 [Candidatus Riflebacteria bacterium]|nr:hypothetical protein [Candidatus Riflebacteria bacterium]
MNLALGRKVASLAAAGVSRQFGADRRIAAGEIPAPFDLAADWPRLAAYLAPGNPLPLRAEP